MFSLKACKCLFLCSFFQSGFLILFAQNMSTPYSVYGIGDMEHRHYGFNAGMGYTGIALKTSLFNSGNNPASLAWLEKSVFMANVSAAGRMVGYHGTAIDATNSNNRDFTIKKLSVAVKLNNFWASSIGMQQFSSVNYQFQSTKSIEGAGHSYFLNYSGDGGLSDYYWNNSFLIGKHLSAGITGSFIAGPINQTETIVDNSGNTIESKRRDYYGNGKLNYGLLYSGNLSKKWNASFGTSFSNTTKINYERTLTVTDNSTTIISEEFLKYTKFSLPKTYGAGIALANTKGTTIAADYSFAQWSDLHIKGNGWRLVNSNRISAGIEFASIKSSYLGGTQKNSFQFGAFLNNSYLRVNNHQINEWGLTAGVTHSLKDGMRFGASIEGGSRGTTRTDLIKENYFQFTLNFSYRDFFNSKGRKFD